ncbi:hypothetical protein DFH09DRAFT_1294525 [Mycena vulgaris]|nr:hypothetical protein DFH09DRAFT_1294525 [Mycena vulgaris]
MAPTSDATLFHPASPLSTNMYNSITLFDLRAFLSPLLITVPTRRATIPTREDAALGPDLGCEEDRRLPHLWYAAVAVLRPTNPLLTEFRRDVSGLYKCRICLLRSAGDEWISPKHLSKHVKTTRHLNARKARELRDKHVKRKVMHENHPAASNETPDSTHMFPGEEEVSTASNQDCTHSPRVTDLSPDSATAYLPDFSRADSLQDPPQEFSRLGWTDAAGKRVIFSLGNEEADPLAESLARALRRANGETVEPSDEMPEREDIEDPLFCGVESEADITAEELNERLFGADSASEWFPYLDKAATLQAEVGDPTIRQESGRGTVWYMNEIGESIKKDMANPFTRDGMVFYPEDAGNKLGQVWHGDKMLRDIPDHLLTPTVRHQGVIYYVNELVKRTDGRWFLPKRWLTRKTGMKSVMLASGYHVIDTEDGLVVEQDTLDVVEVASFVANFMQHKTLTLPRRCPTHFGRKLDLGLYIRSPSAIFIDDVSGNKSKQWNKHFSCYMSNAALPRTKLENEFHVRFVANSPFATPLEIMQGVRASIESAFREPVVAWDCEAKEEVLLQPYGLLFAGDNPMQAELCSCAGLNSNFFCRTCHAGGTREWKQCNEGFADILKAGTTRTAAETAEETFQQILTSLEPNISTTLTEAVRLSGIKDTLAQPIIDSLVKMGQDLRKANPNGSSYSPDEVQTILTEELKKHQQKGEGITNPLLDMDGVDMHKDTPTEILHTILLGVVKYYWGQTVWLLEKGKDFPLFQTRLNSLMEEGLNVPKIQADYMCQYKGGLIGKHFKTLSQVMAFAVHGLVPEDVLEAWLILGRLTVLLWHTEIEDVTAYTTELETCINDFINITCKCSPSILISKPKFHFLLHLPFFIRRFGPAVLFSTERYEAYNAVFRDCSIYSNRLTPSRDIAWSFAGIDRVKHIATGGWRRDSQTQQWVCANPQVMRHILEHPEFAAMIGAITYYPAARKRRCEAAEPNLTWNISLAGRALSSRFPNGTSDLYTAGLGVVTCTGDKVLIGQNVIIRQEGGPYSPLSFATIREILVPVPFSAAGVRITVQLFAVDPALHPELHMPLVTRSQQHVVLLREVWLSFVAYFVFCSFSAQDLESAVNLQHDCHRGKCGPYGFTPVIQERERTSKTNPAIHHTDDNNFIVNTASLHNYHQISAATPAPLRTHSFSINDQVALRTSAAVQIREKITDPEELDLGAPEPMVLAPNIDNPDNSEESSHPLPETAVLDDPAFSRIRAARPRKQQLPPPTALELVSGNKKDLLDRLRPPRHRITLADMKTAFEAVQELHFVAKNNRKCAADNPADGRPTKKRRGAVDDESRLANAKILRPFFFNRRGRQ